MESVFAWVFKTFGLAPSSFIGGTAGSVVAFLRHRGPEGIIAATVGALMFLTLTGPTMAYKELGIAKELGPVVAFGWAAFGIGVVNRIHSLIDVFDLWGLFKKRDK